MTPMEGEGMLIFLIFREIQPRSQSTFLQQRINLLCHNKILLMVKLDVYRASFRVWSY